MSLNVKIKKDMGDFCLDMDFFTEAKRIGILGASGSGKSLTLKSIAGIEKPREGCICCEGKIFFDSHRKINLPAARRRAGYLFQSLALFPNMTALENIEAGIKGKRRERLERARETAEKFGLTALSERYPSALSYGQRQRVALARIIASEPEIILLDEPFSSLDSFMRDETLKTLLGILESFEGTVITVSHNIKELYALSSELVIIEDGRAIATGNTGELMNDPPDSVCARLMGIKNFSDNIKIF